jgi:hypothetical protein
MAGLGEYRNRTPVSERRRLALLVHLAASAGDFSPKLADAVEQATDEEVRVMSDLVDHGMAIPELVSVLQGAHVVVGDDTLYERWIFPKSRRRMSSHHRRVDKAATPDYGLDGPLVRESLHGKAAMGTWVQLERTKATFQWGKLPTWSDVIHIRDYLIYRATGKNVGPWGLSAHVDTRPMVLRPPQTTSGRGANNGIAAFTASGAPRTRTGEAASRWSDLVTTRVTPIGPAGDLFGPPTVAQPREMLPDAPFKDDLGLGLFGPLPIVRSRVPLRPEVAAHLDASPPLPMLQPAEGRTESHVLPVGRQAVTVRGVVLDGGDRPQFVGIEEVPS